MMDMNIVEEVNVHVAPSVFISSINLLAFYRECCSLIGYDTH